MSIELVIVVLLAVVAIMVGFASPAPDGGPATKLDLGAPSAGPGTGPSED